MSEKIAHHRRLSTIHFSLGVRMIKTGCNEPTSMLFVIVIALHATHIQNGRKASARAHEAVNRAPQ